MGAYRIRIIYAEMLLIYRYHIHKRCGSASDFPCSVYGPHSSAGATATFTHAV